jgi:hypothetical protein
MRPPVGLLAHLLEGLQNGDSIPLVAKDNLPMISAAHDVVHRSWEFDWGFARQATRPFDWRVHPFNSSICLCTSIPLALPDGPKRLAEPQAAVVKGMMCIGRFFHSRTAPCPDTSLVEMPT